MEQVRLDPLIPRFQAVLAYLSQEDYYGPVLVVLDCLDGSRVPKSIPTIHDSAFVHLLGARKALIHSSAFFRLLFHCPHPSTKVRDYVQRCVEKMLERWEGVCKWMTYLVVNDTNDVVQGYANIDDCASKMTALRNCVDTLITIFTSGAGYPLIELASLPCTVNLLCAILSHIDSATGKYELWDTYADPMAKCTVTELLRICWDTPWAGRDAAISQLKTQKRHTRQKILSSLVHRAQQMAEDADGVTVAGYSLSVARLAQVMITLSTGLKLWRELYRANILPDLAGALTTIIKKAHSANLSNRKCWNRMSDAARCLAWSAVCGTLDPVYCLSSLMESGLFTAALLCLHHQDASSEPRNQSSFSFGALNVIVPYLYHEEVFSAAVSPKQPGVWDIIDAQPPRMCGSNEVPQIWGDMWKAMDVAYEAHSGDLLLPVCMCSNTKHAERYGLTDYGVWACSRCRWVTYCSSACQQEDWYYVHQYECRGLSQSELVQAERLSSARALLAARRSQVAYLQEALNRPEYLDRLHTAHAQSSLNPNAPQIPVFRLPNAQFIMASKEIDEPGPWGMHVAPYAPGEVGELWERRYARFVEELRMDEHSILCEGYFSHPHKLGMATRALVRVRCFANEEGNTKWRVVGHAFRVAPISVEKKTKISQPAQQ